MKYPKADLPYYPKVVRVYSKNRKKVQYPMDLVLIACKFQRSRRLVISFSMIGQKPFLSLALSTVTTGTTWYSSKYQPYQIHFFTYKTDA